MPHSNRETLPKDKKSDSSGQNKNRSSNPNAKDSERNDRSIPIAILLIIGMGLLLINGFLFMQGFFTNLFSR